jgi:hypothetical protein
MRKLYKNKNFELVRSLASQYWCGTDSFQILTPYFIDCLRNDTENLYNKFLGANEEIAVIFQEGQPYENLDDMKHDYLTNNTLRISTDFNDSKLFGKECNLKNRAVHDFLHIILDAKFTFEGELKVFKHTAKLMSPDFKKVLFSEYVMQTAYTVHFGEFPEQKIIL